LVLVDGAQGGHGADDWAGPNADEVWSRVDDRLKLAGVTPKQVQTLWLKHAIRVRDADPYKNAQSLKGHLVTILNRAKKTFPNLQIAYLSSRSFGGQILKNGEPEQFLSGFAVRWVIQDQIAGKPELNYDPAKGEVKAPLLLWGPYLWADGLNPRKSDGLIWKPEDFQPNGPHPSAIGRKKVVDLLMKFFKTDPNAKLWFVNK
jgi:hypothetical protein